jgi:hypothetical protein
MTSLQCHSFDQISMYQGKFMVIFPKLIVFIPFKRTNLYIPPHVQIFRFIFWNFDLKYYNLYTFERNWWHSILTFLDLDMIFLPRACVFETSFMTSQKPWFPHLVFLKVEQNNNNFLPQVLIYVSSTSQNIFYLKCLIKEVIVKIPRWPVWN